MVEQEEKRWLRALLEGEVEPGSEEWEQVCTDSAFTRVREKVGAVARLDFTQQEDEVEGMWRVLVDRRKKGLERRARGRKRLLRWISGTAVVVALGIGGWLSIRGVEREQVVEVVHAAGRGRGFGFRGGLFRRGGFGLSRGVRGLRRGSAAGDEAQNHDQSQKNSEKLLHCLFPPNF